MCLLVPQPWYSRAVINKHGALNMNLHDILYAAKLVAAFLLIYAALVVVMCI